MLTDEEAKERMAGMIAQSPGYYDSLKKLSALADKLRPGIKEREREVNRWLEEEQDKKRSKFLNGLKKARKNETD